MAVVSRLTTACSTCFGMSSGSVEFAAYSLVKMLLMHMLQLGAAVNRVAVHSWQVTFHMQSTSLDLKPDTSLNLCLVPMHCHNPVQLCLQSAACTASA